MDGAILCSYEIEEEYHWISGLVVLDASRLVVLCYTEGDKKRCSIRTLTWTDGKLELVW
jgi:hypothetical protein